MPTYFSLYVELARQWLQQAPALAPDTEPNIEPAANIACTPHQVSSRRINLPPISQIY